MKSFKLWVIGPNEQINESKKEVKEADWFDYIVINYPDKIEKAVEELTLLLGLVK